MNDSDKRAFDYDETINAGIRAKQRGARRATRDFVIIQLVGSAALFCVIVHWLS